MTKQMIVNTAVQAAVMNAVLVGEMTDGFWKDGRPKGANEAWRGVTATTGKRFGPVGFTVPRTYNYLNPAFLKDGGDRMLTAAQAVEPNVTMKKLYRELSELSRIVGGRFTESGGKITKLNRGQRPAVKKLGAKSATRKVAANIVEVADEEVTA